MITEVALITISCVLFIQMGLSDAIGSLLHIKIRVTSCPKCCCFWACLIYGLTQGNSIVVSVATSFIASYCAMWMALLYDSLAILYNYFYEQITKNQDTSKDAERP